MSKPERDDVIMGKDGVPIKVGDVLYNTRGNEVTVIHLREYRKPRNLFERFVSIGKEGGKMVLRYVSSKGAYADHLYCDRKRQNMLSKEQTHLRGEYVSLIAYVGGLRVPAKPEIPFQTA